MLHDLTSSYLEGHCCPLAKRGYSRDGKPQIVFGLLCNQGGCPVAVEVFDGNTADPATPAAQLDKLRRRFGLGRAVLDRRPRHAHQRAHPRRTAAGRP